MSRVRRQGFTLIELLTVIAIIAILTGLTATVLPRVREKANITRIKGSFAQLNTAFTDYFAKQNSFPPAYGYRVRDGIPPNIYFLRPYTTFVNLYGVPDLGDRFAQSYDTDDNGGLGPLEFLPKGVVDAAGQVSFPPVPPALPERYEGNNLSDQVADQMQTAERPLVYVPVNKRQAAIAKKYWISNQKWIAETWDTDNDLLRNMTFPPQNYDAFVLISVGPGGSAGGVVADPPAVVGTGSPPDPYHIAALRTYFLATRDLNGNQLPDFGFEARSQEGEAERSADIVTNSGTVTVPNTNLPNGKPLYGPLIFESK